MLIASDGSASEWQQRKCQKLDKRSHKLLPSATRRSHSGIFFFLSAVSFLIWLLISSQRWNHVHLMKSLQFGVAFILLAVTFCLRFGLSYFASFFMALKRLICQMIFIIKTTLIASFCRANNWHTLWLCATDTLFKLQFTRLRILWTSRLVVMESILRPALKTMIRKKTKHLQSISICNYVEWTFASWMAWKTIQLHSNLIWTKRFLLIVEKSLKEKVLFHFFFLCFTFFLLLIKVIIIAIVMWCLSLLCIIFFALFFSFQNRILIAFIGEFRCSRRFVAFVKFSNQKMNIYFSIVIKSNLFASYSC